MGNRWPVGWMGGWIDWYQRVLCVWTESWPVCPIMSDVYYLTISSLWSFLTFLISKNSVSFQGLLTVLALEYGIMQRIYGPKSKSGMWKTWWKGTLWPAPPKFNICNAQELIYIRLAISFVSLVLPGRSRFSCRDSPGFMGFKDTFPGVPQSSVREPNVPGVSKS